MHSLSEVGECTFFSWEKNEIQKSLSQLAPWNACLFHIRHCNLAESEKRLFRSRET